MQKYCFTLKNIYLLFCISALQLWESQNIQSWKGPTRGPFVGCEWLQSFLARKSLAKAQHQLKLKFS